MPARPVRSADYTSLRTEDLRVSYLGLRACDLMKLSSVPIRGIWGGKQRSPHPGCHAHWPPPDCCCTRPRIALRANGAPAAGEQIRPIQFSATLSEFQVEHGAYELRIRGWRKFHLLNVPGR